MLISKYDLYKSVFPRLPKQVSAAAHNNNKPKIFDISVMEKLFLKKIGEVVKNEYSYFAAQFDAQNSFLWEVIFHAKQQNHSYSR